MRSISRPPCPALRPFVERVWAFGGGDEHSPFPATMERVLPTGAMHVVLRLSPSPLVLYDDEGSEPREVGHALVGGARSKFYLRGIGEPPHSVGAQVRPGAAPLLLGIPASELAERHTPLADLWGPEAARLHERLRATDSAERRLELLESFLLSRLPRLRAVHPAVAEALAAFSEQASVAEVVRRSGYSHRTFLAHFREAVGLGPKTFGRIRRFQRALDRIRSARTGLAEIAADSGYADQAHLTREFSEIGGMSPAKYRALALPSSNHVPLIR